MRRVGFFCESTPKQSPSVWVNAVVLTPWLAAQGWGVDILPPPLLRILERVRWLPGSRRVAFATLIGALRRRQARIASSLYDVVVVHKAMTDMALAPVLEGKLRKHHRAIIFNFDDAVYECGIPFVAERIALADAVWVGREELAVYARRYNASVYVIGSAVDCRSVQQKEHYNRGSRLELVWTGTRFSFQYLEMLRDVLERFAATAVFRIRVVSGSRFSFCSRAIDDEWIPYSPAREQEVLRESDVALMPLSDGPYERSKENYKIKLYMATGLPIICSPVGANRDMISHDVTGLHASADVEWLQMLRFLAESAEDRMRLGTAARRFVEQEFDARVIGARVAGMFTEVADRQ